ncbi:unnamed protein product [Ilex paraguariensis]|uniref:Uncharacterized protein n=1 Tax=Ilex paraguariensis TaxID=185542 RepID=A0ABC8RL07_9AQUA
MASSNVEVPVFIDTNLDTHIALTISPRTTYGQFKREFESTHLNCFPKFGEIMINGLMVKQKSHFYHLPESLPLLHAFQGEFESTHLNCFPKFGEIMINGLMVKQKSHFYHLPESLPLLHAFQGIKGTWCIHIEACLWSSSDPSCSSKSVAAEVADHNSNGGNVTDCAVLDDCVTSTNMNTNTKRKKKRVKRFHYLKSALLDVLRAVHLSKKKKKKWKRPQKNYSLNYPVNTLEKVHLDRNMGVFAPEKCGFLGSASEAECSGQWDSCSAVETPGETLSESVSVSGIIKKYFSSYEEVTSSSEVIFKPIQSGHKEQLKARTNDYPPNVQVDITPQFAAKTPNQMILFPLPTDPSSEPSRKKLKKTEVGKRLLVASNNLGISASKQKPAVSLFRCLEGKLLMPNSSSLVRSLVFEIVEDDDD